MIFLKTIVLLLSIFISYFLIGNMFEEKIKIPEESIRLRVVANSNSEYDQAIKKEVATSLQNQMVNIIGENDNIEEVKEKISNNINIIDNKINNIFNNKKYKLNYNINLGLNYFPKKEYNGVTYSEGYYESLMVTIGNGEGDNWWCVLFPPLCAIEVEESSNIEYKSLIKEIIDKYVTNEV